MACDVIAFPLRNSAKHQSIYRDTFVRFIRLVKLKTQFDVQRCASITPFCPMLICIHRNQFCRHSPRKKNPKSSTFFGCTNQNACARPFVRDHRQQTALDALTTADSAIQCQPTNGAHEPQAHDQSMAPYDATQQPLVSSMAKHKANAIKIQIQASQSNLNGPTNYRRHISFDDACKKEDGDEVRTTHQT